MNVILSHLNQFGFTIKHLNIVIDKCYILKEKLKVNFDLRDYGQCLKRISC